MHGLVGLLEAAGIAAVADVRSYPFSQYVPHFNRPELESGLRERGIVYVFLGKQLGGRPTDPALYDEEGHVDYEHVRTTTIFQQGLDRLCATADKFPVAMLCAEEDPLDCHRGLLIGPALVERGIHPIHVRADGSRESTAQFEERLLAETRVGGGILSGLFAEMIATDERRQLLADAYRLQSRRKSFRLQPGHRSWQRPADDEYMEAE
jgi:hypothetical protein